MYSFQLEKNVEFGGNGYNGSAQPQNDVAFL